MLSAYFWGILFESLHAMVPITLAGVGEVIGETAGLFDIGLEGIMLISAFTGALGANAAGPSAGMLTGLGTGLAIGLMFGAISTYLRGDQMIIGVGINLFTLGFVDFGLVYLGSPGFTQVHHQMMTIPTPIGNLSPLVFLTLVLPFLIYYLLEHTQLGLKLKAVGENPAAADVAGIRVNLVRMLATATGASLAGLAGAYLSVDWLGSVTKDISAGRGFIALATVVFSGLNPLLTLLGGFVFGFFDALGTWVANLPGIKNVVPWQFLRMTPYIVTLLVVAGVIGRVRFPKALGKPYIRE